MMTDEMEILQNKHQKKLKERIFKRRYFYTTNFTKPEMEGMEYESPNININTALMHHKVYIRSQDINSLNKIIPVKKYIKINEFPKFNEEDRIIEFHPDGTATEYICKITLKGLRLLHGDLITVLTKEEKEWQDRMSRRRCRSGKRYITINLPMMNNENLYYDKILDNTTEEVKSYHYYDYYIRQSEVEVLSKIINIKYCKIIDEFPEFNQGDYIVEIHPDNTSSNYYCNITLEAIRKEYGENLTDSECIKIQRISNLV